MKPTPELQKEIDARFGIIEERGEGPILLTISAPYYSRDHGRQLCMAVTLRRRFETHELAQKYVTESAAQEGHDDLNFEIDPPISQHGRLALIEHAA